jgi:ankyrin repeat protein
METKLRFQILSICLCVLAWTSLSWSQTPSEPNVVFSIEEWAAWARVFGADSPAFTLYDTRDLIYFDRQMYEYACVQLSEGEYARLLEEVVPKDLSMLDDGYMRACWTDQNIYYFYFGTETGRTVYVYGHPTTNYGDDKWTFEIPQSLRRCFSTIERYQNRRAARWVPELIEVLVWDMFPTDEQFVQWPSEWPDLYSAETIRRSGVSSVFLPRELYDEFLALLDESEGIVMMNGRPMVIWYRLPIPGEEVFDHVDDGSIEPSEDTPLHIAAWQGDLETVTSLVESGADVNVRNSYGQTPLYDAASGGHYDVVEYLIANGADVNAQNEEGQTPLHVAIWWMYDDVAQLLLANGADINVRARHGKTALHLAAEWGWEDTAELLITLGADIEARTDYGNTPLLCALDFREPNLAALLLSSGADIWARNDANDTALHYTTDDPLADVASELLSGGLDPNARNDAHDTPLYSAARDGATWVVELLLTQGADVRAAKPDGRTALHAAAFQGHTEIVALLLSHNADVNAATDEGQMPLDYALAAGRDDVATQLRAAGAKAGVEGESTP